MSRALLKWQWRDEPNLVVLWTYLLIHAAHDIAEYRGVTVARGQVATCRNKLASETGLNEWQVRVALRRLAKRGRIAIQATKRCTVITIRDFEQYCRTER